jgi:BTB/POZ domain
MSNADVILRSINLVNFRVHKSVLATSSPFFDDMFTLSQPHNTETIDGLPVVDLSEDAETLNSLMSMLYPVSPEIPKTNDDILALLATSQKFDMAFVQSSIRAQVKHKGLLSPKGAEAFRVYALACQKKLIPEMTTAAYLTMGYPFTFEYLGEALRSFEGWALRDLASFRQRCTDSLVSCFKGFLGHRNGALGIWIGCPGPLPVFRPRNEGYSPIWLQDLFSGLLAQVQGSTYTLDPSHFRKEYSKALNDHISKRDCHVCARVHALKGEEFCLEITDTLAQAQDILYSFWNTGSLNVDRNPYVPANRYLNPALTHPGCGRDS